MLPPPLPKNGAVGGEGRPVNLQKEPLSPPLMAYSARSLLLSAVSSLGQLGSVPLTRGETHLICVSGDYTPVLYACTQKLTSASAEPHPLVFVRREKAMLTD